MPKPTASTSTKQKGQHKTKRLLLRLTAVMAFAGCNQLKYSDIGVHRPDFQRLQGKCFTCTDETFLLRNATWGLGLYPPGAAYWGVPRNVDEYQDIREQGGFKEVQFFPASSKLRFRVNRLLKDNDVGVPHIIATFVNGPYAGRDVVVDFFFVAPGSWIPVAPGEEYVISAKIREDSPS